MLHNLQYYASAAREAIHNNDSRDLTYEKIHEAATSTFENPPELKALPWIQERKFVTTAPADALNAAIRTFAARMPTIQIQPLSDAPEEYARTEQLEEVMKWDFARMNRMGKKSPHWKIVEYAMKYCAVAIETSYLPFVYQDTEKTPRIKEILRSRNFRWVVHDPTNIHVRESDDVLECVVNCYTMTGQELVDKFGVGNPGIQEMLRGFDPKDPAALSQASYSFYDYSDWEARVKWISRNEGGAYLNRDAPAGIEISRRERTTSFLPWVFVDNEEPILKQMVDAELWDNVNILRTMQFSRSVDQAAHPEYWIRTPDGTLRGVNIDNTNPNQPIVTAPGVEISQLRPGMLDPQLSAMVQNAEQEVFRTTVAQILASVEKYAGTQNFSVVNAMLSAAIAQLSLAQMCAERAETLAMVQNFRWIEESEIPMVGFRAYTKGEGQEKGKEVVIKPDDFDSDFLYLNVTLNPSSVMDTQTEINNAINKVERLGMSRKMAWDEIGMENFELSEAQKTEEDLYLAWVQAKGKEILMKPDLMAQQMMQQMAQQQQANPAPGGEQSQFAAAQGIKGNPAMPGQGREQLTGQTASGQEIA